MQSRKTKVKREDLLRTLRENKARHQTDHAEAIVSYRKEAEKQLMEQMEKLKKGGMNIELDLVNPVDLTSFYDKAIKLFEWEVEESVELTTAEFEEYILDEDPMVKHAYMSNSRYK